MGRTMRMAPRNELRPLGTNQGMETLRDILGADVSTSRLQMLLETCVPAGDVSAAVSLHYATAGPAAASNSDAPLAQLRAMGISGTHAQLRALLQRAGGGADAAADLFFEEGGTFPTAPGEAGPSSQAGARLAAAADDVEMIDASAQAQAAPQELAAGGAGPSAARGRRPVRVTVRHATDYVEVETSSSPESSSGSDSADNEPDEEAGQPRGPVLAALAVNRVLGSLQRRPVADADPMYVPRGAAGRHNNALGNGGMLMSMMDSSDDSLGLFGSEDDSEEDEDPQALAAHQHGFINAFKEIQEDYSYQQLGAACLSTAKIRQPPLPLPPSQLHLPLAQFRLPDSQGGRLFCSEAEQVPTEPVGPLAALRLRSVGWTKLGSITLPLLPFNSPHVLQGAAQHTRYQANWQKTKAGQEADKATEILKDLLSSGQLPLESLTLVGGGAYSNPAPGSGCGWTSVVCKVAVAVLADAPGWAPLLKAWTKAELPVNKCQTVKQLSQEAVSYNYNKEAYKSECIVIGFLAPEHAILFRALALLSKMPQNLQAREVVAGKYEVLSCQYPAPQDDLLRASITSLLGQSSDNKAKDAGPADGPATGAAGPSVKPSATGKPAAKSPKRPAKKAKTAAGAKPVPAAPAADGTTTSTAALTSPAAANGRGRKRKGGPDAPSDGPGAANGAAKGAAGEGAAGNAGDGNKPAGKKAASAKTTQTKGVLHVTLTIVVEANNLLKVLAAGNTTSTKAPKAPEPACGAYRSAKVRATWCGEAFADVLHALLVGGNGLWLGPDCDGALNFCDNGVGRQTGVAPAASSSNGGAVDAAMAVGGVSVQEYAGLVGHEVDRLTAALTACKAQERKDAASVTRTKRALEAAKRERDEGIAAGRGALGGRWRIVEDAQVEASQAEVAVAQTRAHRRTLEIALALARRAAVIFAAAGLCEPPPPEVIADEPGAVPGDGAGPSSAGRRGRGGRGRGRGRNPTRPAAGRAAAGNGTDDAGPSTNGVGGRSGSHEPSPNSTGAAGPSGVTAAENGTAGAAGQAMGSGAGTEDGGTLQTSVGSLIPVTGQQLDMSSSAPPLVAAAGSAGPDAAGCSGSIAQPAAATAQNPAPNGAAGVGNANLAARQQAAEVQPAGPPAGPSQPASLVGDGPAGPSAPEDQPGTPRSPRAARPKRQAPAVEAGPLPWVPEISLGLLLAAEKIGGEVLLKRDPQGWVELASVDECRGVVGGSERLPASAFGVHHLLDSIATPLDAETVKAPDQLNTVPKAFQLQGLSWMLSRERKSDAMGRGVLHLHPSWIQFVTESGWIFYVNKHTHSIVTMDFTAAPVETTCGGFLCDEMGLGKTLESLMLVVSNPPPPGWAVSGNTHPPTTQEQQAVPIKATLLVMPNNLASQWQEELMTHLKQGALRWGVYMNSDALATIPRGNNPPERKPSAAKDVPVETPSGRRPARTRNAAPPTTAVMAPAAASRAKEQSFIMCMEPDTKELVSISELDLVFLSYEQLRKELARKSELHRYGFWRIMLDEAQLVANTNSVAAEMASSLWRRHAWVVTGTPISSNLNEVAGLCEFLDADPFYKPTFWRANLLRPYETHSRAGLLAMRSLLRGVMLRRTKVQVESQLLLPPCVSEDRVVTLSRIERAFYEQLREDFRKGMTALKNTQRQMANNAFVPGRSERLKGQVSRVMSALTALRQCCCHPHIVRREAAKAQTGSERASMREIMGRLVLQAYANLDTCVASWFSARLLVAALHNLGHRVDESKRPGGAAGGASVSLAQLRVELQGQAQLAAMYNLRRASLLCTATGTARLDPGLVQQEVDASEGRLLSVQAALESGDMSQTNIILIEPPSHNLLVMDPPAPGPGTNPGPNGQAAGSSGSLGAGQNSAAGTSNHSPDAGANGTGPVLIQVRGIRDTRPFGQFPDAAFQTQEVHAVLAPPAGRANAGPGGDDAQDMLQMAAQAELEAEIKQISDTQRERRRRWSKLEADLHTLHAYTLRKAHPACVALAQQAEGSAPLPAAAEAAGSSSGAGAWGAGQGPDVHEAAVRLWAARQRLNILRLELGLEPVVDVDNAELRRSKREARASGKSAAGVEVEGSDQDHDDDDDDEEDSEEDNRKRKKRKGKAKSTPSKEPVTALDAFLRSDYVVRRLETLLAMKDPLKSALHDVETQQQAMQKANHELQHMINKEQEALEMLGANGNAAQAPVPGQPAVKGVAPAPDEPTPMAVDPPEGASKAQRGGAKRGTVAPAAAPAAVQPAAAAAAGPSGTAGSGAAGPSGAAPNAALFGGLPRSAAATALIAAAVAAAAKTSAAAANEGGENALCPICLDVPERRVVTVCGHHYCADCIHSIVPEAQGGRGAPCPICRKPLTRKELFETMSQAEADKRQAEQVLEMTVAGAGASASEYGAKVHMLLQELTDMFAADSGCKALVLSSWGRLLRLVADALEANHVPFASFLASNAAERDKALQRFHHDPKCRVLLLMMSTSGGAAGLTLTDASTAFILEPPVNPGLEAQAAARIHRLGQTRPTRIVRFIAADTVEQNVLALQAYKLSSQGGRKPAAAPAGAQGGAGTSSAPAAAVPPGAGEGEEEVEAEEVVVVAAQDLDTGTLTRFFGSV